MQSLSGGCAYIISDASEQAAIDLSGWRLDLGAPIISFSRTGQHNQRWTLQPAGDGHYGLLSDFSERCLEVDQYEMEAGARARQWFYWSGQNQRWRPHPAGDGYALEHVGTGLFLQRPTGVGSLTVERKNGDPNQVWKFVPVPPLEQPLPRPSQDLARALVEARGMDPHDHGPTCPAEIGRRASEALRAMRLDPASLAPFRQSPNVTIFRDDSLFVKVINHHPRISGWTEPFWTQWAAKHGFGAPFVGYDDKRGVMVTRIVRGPPDPSFPRTLLPRLLGDLHRIHAMPLPPHSPAHVPDMFEAPAALLREVSDAKTLGPIDPRALLGLLEHVRCSQQSAQVRVVPRFGDLWLDNVLYQPDHDRIVFVDWEDAHLGDAMMDIARLASMHRWGIGDHPALVRNYHGVRPDQALSTQMEADLRQLQRCTTVVDLYLYAFYTLRGTGHRTPCLRHYAANLRADASAVGSAGLAERDEWR